MSVTGEPLQIDLLFLVPLLNIGMFLWFAIFRWPIERELAELRGELPEIERDRKGITL